MKKLLFLIIFALITCYYSHNMTKENALTYVNFVNEQLIDVSINYNDVISDVLIDTIK